MVEARAQHVPAPKPLVPMRISKAVVTIDYQKGGAVHSSASVEGYLSQEAIDAGLGDAIALSVTSDTVVTSPLSGKRYRLVEITEDAE